jgi:hypothetical protein
MASRTLGSEQQTDPPSVGYVATLSDATNDPSGPFRAISASAAGTVKATMTGGVDVAFYVAAGVQFSGHFVRIWSPGTAATDVVGWR